MSAKISEFPDVVDRRPEALRRSSDYHVILGNDMAPQTGPMPPTPSRSARTATRWPHSLRNRQVMQARRRSSIN
jgi:hypothetical protein